MKYLVGSWFSALLISLLIFSLSVVVYAERISPDKATVGEVVDIALFGRPISGDRFVGVEWNNPRDVYEVRITGVNAKLAPSLRLEWWASVWPSNGSGGWMRLDDPWNGKWIRINVRPELNKSGQHVFKFPPLSSEEWHQALKPGQYPNKKSPLFRRTLKMRVIALPQGVEDEAIQNRLHLSVLGNSYWKEANFDIETRHTHNGTVIGRIEVTNGILLGIQSLPEPCPPGESLRMTGRRIKIRYVDNEDLNSNDMTRVTVRFGKDVCATGFSFVPQDILKKGAIRLSDFSTLVSETSRGLTLANDPGPAGNYWAHPVRKRLRECPEMTREAAMAGIPRLSPVRWVPLGVPSARQEFFVGPDGDWMLSALSLNTDKGRDAKRWVFKKDFGKERQWDKFVAMLDTRMHPKFDGGDREKLRRYLEDGHLPLIHVEWYSGSVRYHHALIATILAGDYGNDVSRRGDETVVLLSKLQLTNTSDTPQLAALNLRYSVNVPLILKDEGIIAVRSSDRDAASEGLFALRGQVSMDMPAGGGTAGWTRQPGGKPESPDILRWQATLKPKEECSIYFKTPFVELLDAEELARLKKISFEKEVPRVMNYWRKRLARGMQIAVPDEALNNFYKANLWHNVITTDRDPLTGLYNQGVATVRYRVFANETSMVARSMDMRGEHTEAQRFLEPMLYYQGKEHLKGRFSTKEGVFHSAGDYTHGEYAMNHGFVLWAVADHYLMTRDRTYLERVAPKLVKGCDFLISERNSTMSANGSARSPKYGLSPASSLEDVVEYQYWFATNAYFYLGMKRVVQALADIGHTEAKRIAAEAEKYRSDIEANIREAATISAVVPLRDGNYIPYVPSRVYQWRHLTEGWIREALYCSLHLAAAEVLSPDDTIVTWMLDELEDNIFFSWQSGYNVADYEQTWFERGGLTLQPCLLDTPIVYMARDEISAALRSFWNTYALLVYPDTQCFAEWARRFGVGGGPVYKTSDESRFIMWLRQLLVWENGDQLWFARATQREWLKDGNVIRIERAPTIFGIAGIVIRSKLSKGKIHATVTLPGRNPPAEVWLRLRHPNGLQPNKVSINGKPIGAERIVGPDIRLVPGAKDLTRPVEVTAEYLKR
jgi:hypothetical protein